jgi:hypothetical protein
VESPAPDRPTAVLAAPEPATSESPTSESPTSESPTYEGRQP